MKGYKSLIKNKYAVSEVVGGILLVLIAVVAFSAIYLHLIPDSPAINPSVEIYGEVTNTGRIVLAHKGGITLTDYEIDIRYYENNTPIGSKTINNDNWKINQYRYPLELLEVNGFKLIDKNCKVNVQIRSINSDGSKTPVFSGVLSGNINIIPEFAGDIILISTLRTDTTDEDLICFSKNIESDITPKTYIYNWLVNNESFANIIMPFDTNHADIAKDYSKNNINGNVQGAQWVSNGVSGGAYYFDGGGDRIDLALPELFNDLSEQDFTISVWINSDNISDNMRRLLEGGTDNTNFFRIYQHDEALTFGVRIDQTTHRVKTTNLSSNTWHHIVAVWDASKKDLAIYTNGVKSIKRGEGVFDLGATEGLTLGTGVAGHMFWQGYIDEFQIYDKILSEEQIYQMYLSVKDGDSYTSVIVSEETLTGQIWECIVTPNDDVQDGEPVESNPLQIIPYSGGK